MRKITRTRLTGWLQAAAIALGALHLSQVARLTLLEGEGGGGVNLVPLRTIHGYLFDSVARSELRLQNVAGNLELLLPLGILLATVTRLRPGRAAVALAAVASGIEGLQWLLPQQRSVDIDDVILNVAGGTAGYALGLALLWLIGLVAPSATDGPARAPAPARAEIDESSYAGSEGR